jgi:hypothetical protein
MLIIALQYWKGDQEQALRLARRLADIEDAPRTDVQIEFVLRFDAPEVDKDTLAYVGKKFPVSMYRCKRREQHHPGGPNGMVHDLFGEYWRRCLRVPGFKDNVDGIFLYEADNVPLHKKWLDQLLMHWKHARAEDKWIMGCWQDAGSPVGHINGNMFFVPDLFNRIRGLEGCPTQYAWDLFHAEKFQPHWYKCDRMANLYRATNVPRSWLYARNGTAKFANVHGVKDDSAWNQALQLFQENSEKAS